MDAGFRRAGVQRRFPNELAGVDVDAKELKQVAVRRHRWPLTSEVEAFAWLLGLPFADDAGYIEAFSKCDW